jgi:hypothetical protein
MLFRRPSFLGETKKRNMRFSRETRTNHAERYRVLAQELAASLFEKAPAWEVARDGVLGCLNYQLAKLVGRDALEDRLNLPFSLGYVFGAAAWFTYRFQVKRPGWACAPP